jgi:hypothetical protein
MEVTTAREIIKRAKADETYEGPIPEDNATLITEAQSLVEMAEQAWAQHIRGPDVEAILRLAAEGQDGAAADEEQATEEPEAEVEDAPKADVIPSKLTNAPANLQKSEPWEGYGEYRVSDVTNGLNWYRENDPEAFLDLLRHVWAYETSHKNRSRILEFAVEIWKRSGGEVDAEEDVEAEATTAESERAEEATAEATAEAEADVDESIGDELQAAEEEEGKTSDATDVAERETRPARSEGRPDERKPSTEDRPGGSGAYRKLIEIVERELKNERLDGIPEPPKEEAPELPWKWADVTDTQLQNMHMQYASFAYYKGYVRARDERIALHCKEAADELHNALLVKAPKYDEKGKEIKVTVLEAEISSDSNVKRWRKLQRKHELLAAQAKQEQESYLKLVEALSRLETMRHNAWERSKR